MRNPEYLVSLFQASPLPSTTAELPRVGRAVELPTMLRHERQWKGDIPASLRLVPNKPTLCFDGQATWAEFILLRLLERDRWVGAWVKNWGGLAFWRGPCNAIELSATASALFQRIQARTAGRGGCWDIFAWRGDEVLFVESKQRGRDRLRLTQRTWLENSLEEGVSLSSFVIVEWLARHPGAP